MIASIRNEITHLISVLFEAERCTEYDTAVQLVDQLKFAESQLYSEAETLVGRLLDFDDWLTMVRTINEAMDSLCETWDILV